MTAGSVTAGKAFVTIGADLGPLKKSLGEMSAMMKEAGAKISALGGQFIAAGAAITAPFVFAAKTAADFEQEMAAVLAITGAAGDEFDALTAKARELGSTTTFSATEVAQGMRFLGMAGFDTTQIIAGIPAVLNLAKAGMLDLGRAADIVSDIGTAFGITGDEVQRVADVIAVTASSANTSVELMGESMKFVASTAAVAGQSLEDVAAIIGVLGNAGIKGSLAGTSLNEALSRLSQTASQEKLSELGIAVEYTDGTMRKFKDILRDVQDATKNLTQGQRLSKYFEIFGRRGARAALIAAEAGDSLDRLETKTNNATGAVERMAGIMGRTTQGAWKEMTSAVQDLAIEVGNALAPTIREWMGTIRDAANSIKAWVTENKDAVVWVAKLGAALVVTGVALKGFGIAVTAAGALIGSGLIPQIARLTPYLLDAGRGVMRLGSAFLNLPVGSLGETGGRVVGILARMKDGFLGLSRAITGPAMTALSSFGTALKGFSFSGLIAGLKSIPALAATAFGAIKAAAIAAAPALATIGAALAVIAAIALAGYAIKLALDIREIRKETERLNAATAKAEANLEKMIDKDPASLEKAIGYQKDLVKSLEKEGKTREEITATLKRNREEALKAAQEASVAKRSGTSAFSDKVLQDRIDSARFAAQAIGKILDGEVEVFKKATDKKVEYDRVAAEKRKKAAEKVLKDVMNLEKDFADQLLQMAETAAERTEEREFQVRLKADPEAEMGRQLELVGNTEREAFEARNRAEAAILRAKEEQTQEAKEAAEEAVKGALKAEEINEKARERYLAAVEEDGRKRKEIAEREARDAEKVWKIRQRILKLREVAEKKIAELKAPKTSDTIIGSGAEFAERLGQFDVNIAERKTEDLQKEANKILTEINKNIMKLEAGEAAFG